MKTHLTILKKLGQDQGALGLAIACLFLLLAVAPFARAQVQTTGTPGSPSATDDQGYGVSGTFGGVIPAMDRLAKAGLRYTQFHSTALCSPTRAALITGRNHHSVGSGVIGEMSTGYPGYDSVIPKDKATIGTILRDNGYSTSWFGKNHNTPTYLYSVAGPFDQWSSGMGFEYFYGFMGTPLCLISPTTAPAWPRAAPASFQWTARKLITRRSRTRSPPS
jgi:hypothetical protein